MTHRFLSLKINTTPLLAGQDLEKKGFIRLYKAVDNDYTNWVEVGDLDFANDRTAYMMECPNLVFVGDQPVLLYCPQGLDKSVLDYDNISSKYVQDRGKL